MVAEKTRSRKDKMEIVRKLHDLTWQMSAIPLKNLDRINLKVLRSSFKNIDGILQIALNDIPHQTIKKGLESKDVDVQPDEY